VGLARGRHVGAFGHGLKNGGWVRKLGGQFQEASDQTSFYAFNGNSVAEVYQNMVLRTKTVAQNMQ
jgi:hypothetical protein